MAVDLTQVPVFYHKYIALVSEMDLQKSFVSHKQILVNTLKKLPAQKWDYRYAPDKWTIKDLVQHMIDAERIFCYRALRFARKDKTELPGFDENSYAQAAEAGRRKSDDLIDELSVVQRSSAQLFASFSKEQLLQSGVANGNKIYVEAIGFIIIGHALHHLNILKERYGVEV